MSAPPPYGPGDLVECFAWHPIMAPVRLMGIYRVAEIVTPCRISNGGGLWGVLLAGISPQNDPTRCWLADRFRPIKGRNDECLALARLLKPGVPA